MVLCLLSSLAQAAMLEVHVAGGVLNGTELVPSNAQVSVSPGAPILGSFQITTQNGMSPNAYAPLVATPNWGDPRTSYWGVNYRVLTGEQSHSVPVDLSAPDVPGTYYIAVALGGTYDYEQILSGTHPAGPADWEHGNILALRPAADFELAMSQGWIPYDYYLPPEMSRGMLGLTAVRVNVVVPEPGSLMILISAAALCAGRRSAVIDRSPAVQ